MQSLRVIAVGLLGLWLGALMAQDSGHANASKSWEQLVHMSKTQQVWPSTSSIKVIPPTTAESYAWLHDDVVTLPAAYYPNSGHPRTEPWWSLWMLHVWRSSKNRVP